jgi:hypothetical protein
MGLDQGTYYVRRGVASITCQMEREVAIRVRSECF